MRDASGVLSFARRTTLPDPSDPVLTLPAGKTLTATGTSRHVADAPGTAAVSFGSWCERGLILKVDACARLWLGTTASDDVHKGDVRPAV